MAIAADEVADTRVARPAHVPAARGIDFDINEPLEEGTDIHAYWRDLVPDAPVSLM